MNFLAHFFLSQHPAEFVVGSFLGDFVRGDRHQDYAPGVARGILLHREIDRFTDTHPVFRQSKRRLVPQQGHYAGVVVDIFYDHLLAQHWTRYADEPLPDLAQRTYATLRVHHDQLPPPAQRVLHYMQTHDWLTNYARPEGMARALMGLQRRARFPNRMAQAAENWPETATLYAQEFHRFFPEIQAHVARYRLRDLPD